jgi:hypothetical protein
VEAPQHKVYIANTVTGQIVMDAPFVGIPRYDTRLNASGGLTVTVPLGDSGAMSKKDFEEFANSWRWTWLYCYGSYIFQAGPAVTDRFSDNAGPPTADVGCGGLLHLFTKRVLLNKDWVEGQSIATPVADLSYNNLTLRNIAKLIVENDLDRPDHDLPIVLPGDDPASTHERNYKGYDLASVSERLLQLTQVINGPEIEFRPVFVDPQTKLAIQWEMRVGSPRLGMLSGNHAWDYGSALSHLDYDRDGSQQSMAHFQKGSGSERALLSAYQDDRHLLDLDLYPYPELETVGTDTTSVEDGNVLQERADGYVATHGRAIVTWDATVRIDGTDGQGRDTQSPTVDLVNLGDTALFQVYNHRRILDGKYYRRILGMTNGPDRMSTRLILQPTA